MRGRGGLLPEQVWDTNPLPWQYLRPGEPTGSAMPLAWAHSELIKLAVAASTGRPVEMLTLVSDRYQQAAVPSSATWFWRDTTPVRALPAGRTLVVAGAAPVHPALRLRRMEPRHHRRTRRPASRSWPVRGHPGPGRPHRAREPAVRPALPGRKLGTRHPQRCRAGSPRARRRPPVPGPSRRDRRRRPTSPDPEVQ